MAYGLSKIAFSPGERVPVGERDGWAATIGEGGLFLERAPSSRPFLGKPTPSNSLGTHLAVLADQEYCSREGDVFFFTHEEQRSLREEDKVALYNFCGWLPCSLELHHQQNLGHPDFRLEIRFKIGGTRIYPEISGAFARHEGLFYRMSEEMLLLFDEVKALNELETDEKRDLPKALQAWAGVNEAARASDTRLDEYLSKEEVVVPGEVQIDVRDEATGSVSIVPTFQGVDPGAMHDAYLGSSEIQGVYSTQNEAGGRVRVVLTEEVHKALSAIRTHRRLTPREQDEVFSRPDELLPDGIDPSAVDLSLYGPRVREIGEYASTVRPFSTEARDWGSLETLGNRDPEGPGQSSAEPSMGLVVTHANGETEEVNFDSPGEAEELAAEIEKAINASDPVVEFRGVKLPATRDLLGQLESCIQKFEQEDQAEEKKKSASQVVGPLPYENLLDAEYEDPEHDVFRDRSNSLPGSLKPHVILKDHQTVGFQWLAASVKEGKTGALLADDMGLGKTLQALTFAAWLIETDVLKTGLSSEAGPWDPILVVAPVILLDVWREEIETFFDSNTFLPYQILDSSALRKMRTDVGREGKVGKSVLDRKELTNHRLVISNYDAVANYGFSFAQVRWSAVISDESHQFKEPSTRVSQVMKSLNTPFRLAMTGTPVVNRLMDVWNLVDFLRPLFLGSQKEFRNSFELKDEDGGPTEGARKLQAALRVATQAPVPEGCVVLRRSKEKELPGLPSKTEHVIPCPMSEAQAATYNELRSTASESTGKGKVLKLLIGLNRLLQHPALEGLLPLDAPPEALISASPKLQELLSQLEEIKKKKEKVLVFAIFCNMQHILKRAIDHRFGTDVKIINGQDSSTGARVRAKRRETLAEFSDSHGFNVLVLSPDVAGVGLTITAANHVFHYGRWWNPAREDQATDRTYRIGQEKEVHVYRLIGVDPSDEFKTFDEHLDELISDRRATAEHFLVPEAEESQMGHSLAEKVLTEGRSEGPSLSPAITSAEDLKNMDPDRFEAFVAKCCSLGGGEVFLTPYGGDAGVDVVAVYPEKVECIQVKHVSKQGRKIDPAAIQQIRNGASHYTANLFSPSLRSRRIELKVVSNGKAASRFSREAAELGVDFVGGSELLAQAKSRKITQAEVSAAQAARADSLQALKAELAQAK